MNKMRIKVINGCMIGMIELNIISTEYFDYLM